MKYTLFILLGLSLIEGCKTVATHNEDATGLSSEELPVASGKQSLTDCFFDFSMLSISDYHGRTTNHFRMGPDHKKYGVIQMEEGFLVLADKETYFFSQTLTGDEAYALKLPDNRTISIIASAEDGVAIVSTDTEDSVLGYQVLEPQGQAVEGKDAAIEAATIERLEAAVEVQTQATENGKRAFSQNYAANGSPDKWQTITISYVKQCHGAGSTNLEMALYAAATKIMRLD